MSRGMDKIRERLFRKGVLETGAQLIISRRRKISKSNYIRPGQCWPAGVTSNRLLRFDVI